MVKPKPPCPPDCQKRQVGCRSSCQDWEEYEAELAEYREWRENKYKGDSDAENYISDRLSRAIHYKHVMRIK